MPAYVAHALDLFQTLRRRGAVRTKPMFGGWGFWCGELMFGLADDDRIYLKTDETNHAHFVDAGCTPFTYPAKDGLKETSYFHPPDDALESAETMAPWAKSGHDAAVRVAARKKKPAAKKPAKQPAPAKKPAKKKPAAKKRR